MLTVTTLGKETISLGQCQQHHQHTVLLLDLKTSHKSGRRILLKSGGRETSKGREHHDDCRAPGPPPFRFGGTGVGVRGVEPPNLRI